MTSVMLAALILLGPIQRSGAGEKAAEGAQFSDVTSEVGLGKIGSTHRVAWGDFNDDGLDDLLFKGARLCVNVKKEKFVEITKDALISTPNGSGGLWGDFNNDGKLDFYEATHGAAGSPDDDAFYKGLGKGKFENISAFAKVGDGLRTEGAGVGDFNGDGYLDIYAANYEKFSDPKQGPLGVGTPDKLFFGSKSLKFKDVTKGAGIVPKQDMSGRCVACCDFDEDGDLDIFVGNYRLNPDFLWLNNGKGHFTDVADNRGVIGFQNGNNPASPENCFEHTIGAAWGDVNGDGHFDLLCGRLSHSDSKAMMTCLYINSGPPDWKFTRMEDSGIQYRETHSSVAFADYDADGNLDFIITCVYDECSPQLYRGLGGGKFEDATASSGIRGNNTWGAAWSDYNGDGFLDLALCGDGGSGFWLYKNRGNSNKWIMFRLEGKKSNCSAIGAQVRIKYKNGDKEILQARQVEGSTGTTCQNSFAVHFGLGDYSGPVDVEIRWPSGLVQTFTKESVNKLYEVKESGKMPEKQPAKPPAGGEKNKEEKDKEEKKDGEQS
jgi:hypothetical protein